MDARKTKMFLIRSIEAFIWIAALIILAFQNPIEHHYTLCPLDNLGLSFCPGCGLGRSISAAFQGEFLLSWDLHPLGIFAILVLAFRIFVVFRNARNYVQIVTKT